jgi:hypothetical protein
VSRRRTDAEERAWRHPRKHGRRLYGVERISPEEAADRRRRFVLAELVAGTSRELTAARAGISVRALDRIAADPAFQGELEAARLRRSLTDL